MMQSIVGIEFVCDSCQKSVTMVGTPPHHGQNNLERNQWLMEEKTKWVNGLSVRHFCSQPCQQKYLEGSDATGQRRSG